MAEPSSPAAMTEPVSEIEEPVDLQGTPGPEEGRQTTNHVHLLEDLSSEDEVDLDSGLVPPEEKRMIEQERVLYGKGKQAAGQWRRKREWRKRWMECATEAERERLFGTEQGRLRAEEREMQLESQGSALTRMVAEVKEEMKQVLNLMDYLPGKISSLFSSESGSGGHVSPPPDEGQQLLRRRLAFVEKELTTIVSALRLLAAPTAVWPEHCDPRINARLTHLRDLADWTVDLLHYGYITRLAAEFPEVNLAWIQQLLVTTTITQASTASRPALPLPPPPPTPTPSPASASGPSTPPELLPWHWHLPAGAGDDDDKRRLVGIDGQRKKLLRWLLRASADGDGDDDESRCLRVVSIVGPAGVGKTTLAMDLLHQIGGGQHYFQCRAAVRVSHRPPCARDLLKHIMSQIIIHGAPAPPSMLVGDGEPELAYDLNKYLQDKSYLIVIDDLWRTSDWEIIRDSFPRNNCSSRIIITSRIRSVASFCCSLEDGSFMHEVKPLGELDSKRLFSDAAFGSGSTCPSDNSSSLVFDEILRRCDGIPLLIIAMANQMRQDQADTADNNKAAAGCWLERIPKLKQVEEALSPSYDDLPLELKLLSLYMSTFPRGHKIDRHDLFRKWDAEGLIAPDTGKAIEDLSEEHFSALLDRYIIHPTMTCSDRNSEVDNRWYHVNDFMLEFLSSISAETRFVATSSHTLKSAAEGEAGGGGGGNSKSWKLERLSFHQSDAELPVLLEKLDVSHTRSLTVSGSVNRLLPLDKFVHLVVLSLEGWQNFEDDDLVQICSSNFRLKYLSVRNTRASKLPDQITGLGYLETLDISHTQITKLPPQLWELPELRVLDLRGTQVRMLPGPMRHRAAHLKHVLINSSDETDLTVTVQVPEDIVYCPRLESLGTVDLSNCSASFVENLARQESLGLGLEWEHEQLNEIHVGVEHDDPQRRIRTKVLESLKVLAVTWSFHHCYDEGYQAALRSAIQKSRRLESLAIHCELGCSMEFLDSLPDAPPQSLQNISIHGRFLAVPKWIQGLENLAFLQITVCKLAPDDVKLLGALPRLECLVLGLHFLPEEPIVIGRDEGFSQLLRLSIDSRMPWIAFRRGSMPKLTVLDLRMISVDPAWQYSEPSDLANLLNLEQITLRYYPCYANCRSVKAVVDAVRRQVAELEYTVRLVINDVEDDVKRSCGDMQLEGIS